MKTKTLLATFLSVFLFVLVGCGGGGEESNNNESGQNGEQSNQSTATASGGSGESYQLRMDLPEGQAYLMTIITEDSSSESAFGQTIERTTVTEMDMRYDVTDVASNGNMTLVSTYERYKTSSEAGGVSLEFDSENPPDTGTPEAKIFGSLIGESFSMSMTPGGNVVDIDGLDQWLSEVMNEVDPVISQMIEPFFEGIFGEEALLEMIQMTFPAYPEDPIQVGDSWETSGTNGARVPFAIDITFTLNGVSDDIATLGVVSTLSVNPNAEPIAIGPVSMQHSNLTGSQEGELLVDLETGWIMSGSISTSFQSELQILGDASSLGLDNEPIPVTGDSVVTYESRELLPD